MTEEVSSTLGLWRLSQMELRVKVPAAIVTATFGKVLRDFQRRVHVKGYRVGKAPLGMVRRALGDKLTNTVMSRLITDNATPAAQRHGLRAAHIHTDARYREVVVEGKPFEFSVLPTELRARVTYIPPYKGIAVSFPEENIRTLDDIDTVNEEACADYVTRQLRLLQYETAERKARNDGARVEAGNRIIVSCMAVDGEQPPELLDWQRKSLIVGVDKSLPGDIERSLYGMQRGETRRIARVVNSEEWSSGELFGKRVTLDITVHEIEELTLSALDDALVKRVTDSASLAELRTKLWEEYRDSDRLRRHKLVATRVLQPIVSSAEIAIPQRMIAEVAAIIKQHQAQTNVKSRVQVDFSEVAADRIGFAAVLEEIGRRENITAEHDDSDKLQQLVVAFLLANAKLNPHLDDEFLAKEQSYEEAKTRVNELLTQALHSAKVLELAPYKQVAVTKKAVHIDDPEVEQHLDFMRYVFATFTLSDEPVTLEKPQLMVVATIVSFRDELLEIFSSPRKLVVIPKDRQLNSLENALVGMRSGASKKVQCSDILPSSGEPKTVDMQVLLLEVRNVELPPLDDRFAREFCDVGDLAALRQKVRERLLAERDAVDAASLKEKILAHIDADSEAQLDAETLSAAVKVVLADEWLVRSWERQAALNDSSDVELAAFVQTEIARVVRRKALRLEIARREGFVDADVVTPKDDSWQANLSEFLLREAKISIVPSTAEHGS